MKDIAKIIYISNILRNIGDPIKSIGFQKKKQVIRHGQQNSFAGFLLVSFNTMFIYLFILVNLKITAIKRVYSNYGKYWTGMKDKYKFNILSKYPSHILDLKRGWGCKLGNWLNFLLDLEPDGKWKKLSKAKSQFVCHWSWTLIVGENAHTLKFYSVFVSFSFLFRQRLNFIHHQKTAASYACQRTREK